ncbi:MAG: DUF4349 domain-containing protein [Planctomycetota bacterium]
MAEVRALTVTAALLAVMAGCGSLAGYEESPKAVASYGMVASERADQPQMEGREEPRMIIRSATVRFECDDPAVAVEKAIERTKKYGGWVQQSGKSYATVRIPDKGLEDFLVGIETLGKITEKEIRGKDVTAQHRDTKIRLENLESAHKRYRELLEKAANVAETLAVEKELERVVTQIELLKGRIRSLEKQVAYSTATLRFRKGTSPGPLGWPFVALYHGVKWLFVWD